MQGHLLHCNCVVGTTVTVLVATGWLLTLANVGDSAAVLDTVSVRAKVQLHSSILAPFSCYELLLSFLAASY